MIRHGSELITQKNENMRGGDGTVVLRHFLNKDELYGKGRLFSHIQLEPGCSIGYHVHEKEAEIFAVVSGRGVFNDNGRECPIGAGDVLVTESGQGHAIACAGSQPLDLIALILYSE